MATTSKKKRVNRAIDKTSKRVKSGVNSSARTAKTATARAFDLERKTRSKVNSTARRAASASGEMLERAGRSLKKAGKGVKKTARSRG